MLIAKLFQILDSELLAVNDCGVAFMFLCFGVPERYPPSHVCPVAPNFPCLLSSQNQLQPFVVYLQALHGILTSNSSNAILLETPIFQLFRG
jgi:hypothetical protein